MKSTFAQCFLVITFFWQAHTSMFFYTETEHEPGSNLFVMGMVIQPLIGNLYNGYINPYYWVDDHPLLYGNIGSLDPSTHGVLPTEILHAREVEGAREVPLCAFCNWMIR